ncbi:hypothetical protein HK101_004727, partial [Irineochytrium annulatum]
MVGVNANSNAPIGGAGLGGDSMQNLPGFGSFNTAPVARVGGDSMQDLPAGMVVAVPASSTSYPPEPNADDVAQQMKSLEFAAKIAMEVAEEIETEKVVRAMQAEEDEELAKRLARESGDHQGAEASSFTSSHVARASGSGPGNNKDEDEELARRIQQDIEDEELARRLAEADE